MDVNTVTTLISSLGFPIVCVIALGYFIWKLWSRQQEENSKREEKLYETISNAQSINEKLTQTNSEFVKVLTDYKSDLNEIKEDVTEIKNNLMKG